MLIFRILRMSFGVKRHCGPTGILFALLVLQAQKRSENTFKNMVSSADSSPRYRFALITGFSWQY